MVEQRKMPPIKPLYSGAFVFMTGIVIAFLGGNGLMLLIGIGIMFYGGFIMMPDAWALYQKYQRFKAQDKKDVAAIETPKLPFIDVPARAQKPKFNGEAYYEDGIWKTRGVA